MGCLGISLTDLGYKDFSYYSSEVNKHAMKISAKLNKNSIQLGNIKKWKEWDIDWGSIDLVGAGSPCQGFSFAGKKLAFNDPRSKLFFVFVDILNHIKSLNPNVIFLLENVKMKSEHEDVITGYCGMPPIRIDSKLVSAQSRKRLYWTNIANESDGILGDNVYCAIPQPKDRGVVIRDILETGKVHRKYYLSEKMLKNLNIKVISAPSITNSLIPHEPEEGLFSDSILTPKRTEYGKAIRKEYESKSIKEKRKNISQLEPRSDGKSNTLTTVQKDNLVIQINSSIDSGGKQPYQHDRIYDINGISPCLNTDIRSPAILIPEATKKGYVQVNPGQCFDGEHPDSKTRRGRLMDKKSNCLMANETRFLHFTNDYRVRRLTPRECGRLQTIPEKVLDDMLNCGVSDTQLYKMFGNGWNVETIKHILSYITQYELLS